MNARLQLTSCTALLALLALGLTVWPGQAKAQVSPDIIGTTTPKLLATTAAGFPSCLAWRPTGVCFFLKCSIWHCEIKTSIRVSHFVPDAIVSTYNDPANHPWTDVGKAFSSILSKAGAKLVKSKLPLDGSAETARETKEIATFKNSDAIGNPLANLPALASGSGASVMPSRVDIPDMQELGRFVEVELPRIVRMWAQIPVTAVTDMANSWRALASNPSSLFAGIGKFFSDFASLPSGLGSGSMPGVGGGGAGGGAGSTGGSGEGAGDTNASTSPSDLQRIVTSAGGGEGGDLFCPGGTQAFNIYYHSDLDSWFWRSYLPLDLLYPQSWIPGFSEVGELYLINTWGNIYPRSGELVQSHPAKASAVLAARTHSIVSREAQPHIYKKLHVPGGFIYFSNYNDVKWQALFPVPENKCIHFGTPDLVGPFSARDFKTSSTDGYIWNMWIRYECCRIKGIYLFSIAFSSPQSEQ